MTKRRGLYVTKTERVSRTALIAEITVKHANSNLSDNIVELDTVYIRLFPPSRAYGKQTLRCTCRRTAFFYPSKIEDVLSHGGCRHIAALLDGRLVLEPAPRARFSRALEDGRHIYLAKLTPIGQQLFGWRVAQRLLAESA